MLRVVRWTGAADSRRGGGVAHGARLSTATPTPPKVREPDWEAVHQRSVAAKEAIPRKERQHLHGLAMERFQGSKEAQKRALQRSLFGVLLFLSWQYLSSESGRTWG